MRGGSELYPTDVLAQVLGGAISAFSRSGGGGRGSGGHGHAASSATVRAARPRKAGKVKVAPKIPVSNPNWRAEAERSFRQSWQANHGSKSPLQVAQEHNAKMYEQWGLTKNGKMTKKGKAYFAGQRGGGNTRIIYSKSGYNRTLPMGTPKAAYANPLISSGSARYEKKPRWAINSTVARPVKLKKSGKKGSRRVGGTVSAKLRQQVRVTQTRLAARGIGVSPGRHGRRTAKQKVYATGPISVKQHTRRINGKAVTVHKFSRKRRAHR